MSVASLNPILNTVLKPTLKPILLDFKNIRIVRQKNNNKEVYESIINNNMKKFNSSINRNEFERTLEDLQKTQEQFLQKCREDVDFCKLASRSISKNASRQCSKDEVEQLRSCNFITEKCGVKIKKLTGTELRPTKDGKIISKKEMTDKKILKDNCLKSFDAKIEGKMKGFISSKISFASGGHQTNVFTEQDCFAEWWVKFKKESEDFLILLIDTDLKTEFERLKEKYNHVKNIGVFNHLEFQQYIIDKYYSEESK